MDDDLIAAHRDLPMLMPFLHLPVQSGSDRDAGGDEPQAHRGRLPARWSTGCAPRGRTSRCRPTSSSAIPARPRPISRPRWRWCARSASPRRSASSIRRGPARPPPARRRRCRRPRRTRRLAGAAGAAARRSRPRFNAGCVGLTLPVLFTGPGRHPGQVAGRSPFLQPVHVTGPHDLIGQEIPVQIAAALPNSLVRNPHRGESLRLSQAAADPRHLRRLPPRQGRDPPVQRQHAAAAAARRP